MELQQCPFCNGKGFVYDWEVKHYQGNEENYDSTEYICIHCNGSGEVEKDYLIPKEER